MSEIPSNSNESSTALEIEMDKARRHARKLLILTNHPDLQVCEAELIRRLPAFINENPYPNYAQLMHFIDSLLNEFKCEMIGRSIAAKYLLERALGTFSVLKERELN